MISPTADTFALPLARRLDMVPTLSDQRRVIEPLPGGLTNTNCKVITSTGTYVARVSRPSADLLAIDRDAEYRNAVIAASTGVAPGVIDYVPAAGVLLIEWLAGRTLQAADLQRPSTIEAVARACRTLHTGPPFVSDFDMFDVQRRYLTTAVEGGFRLPDRYLEFTAQWEQLRRVLAMDAPAVVPCHNDLLAANFIEVGDTLWLIDYEYSGNNDPSFELGNIWSESHLSEDALEFLVDSYYRHHSADPGHRSAMIARVRLQGLVSQYGWTLWGVIQHAVSELEFDFWEWAMDKYRRAVATFDSPAFPDLLAAAAVRQSRTSPTGQGPTEEGETL